MPNTTENTEASDRVLRVIKTDDDYRSALTQAEALVALDPAPETPAGEALELLTLLLEHYESKEFLFDTPDPIEAIVFRMEEQGLMQRDLVHFIGSRSRVSEVLSRKRPLTVQMIRGLADGLGIPLKSLIGRPNAPREKVDQHLETFDLHKVPFREMQKRGWFDELSETVSGTAEEIVRAFFNRVSPAHALFRRRLRGHDLDEKAYYSTLAWSSRVLLRARAQSHTLAAFDRTRITKETFRQLAELSWLNEGPRLVSDFLAKLGIAFVVEASLRGSVLDGAALLSEARIPVIALTLRLDRIDNFWFTLLHELAHVWLHLEHPEESFVDRMELLENGTDSVERDANRVAKDAIVPLSVWKRSEAFLNPSRASIQRFADELHVHPALIAGRIQFESQRFEVFREFLGQGQVRKLFQSTRFA